MTDTRYTEFYNTFFALGHTCLALKLPSPSIKTFTIIKLLFELHDPHYSIRSINGGWILMINAPSQAGRGEKFYSDMYNDILQMEELAREIIGTIYE